MGDAEGASAEQAHVEVVVPYRAGCPHREQALNWVLERYAATYPEWTVTVAEAPDGPWVKALAVMPAIRASVADAVVIADADCWTDGLEEAVAQVRAGAAWAMPHTNVHRLDETGTEAFLAGRPWDAQPLTQRPYRGIAGGGFVALARTLALAVPLDPRFVGWGQEDESYASALATLAGGCWRGDAPLVHLWHPPQQRMSRTRGSVEGWQLRRRYMRAHGDTKAMATLIEEAHEHLAVDLDAVCAPATLAAGRTG